MTAIASLPRGIVGSFFSRPEPNGTLARSPLDYCSPDDIGDSISPEPDVETLHVSTSGNGEQLRCMRFVQGRKEWRIASSWLTLSRLPDSAERGRFTWM